MRRPQLNHPKPADLGLTATEGAVLRALKTPAEIQEFVIGLHANFEYQGDTLRSVRGVLKHRQAHCIEAAFTAACALWLQGEPPLIVDLTAKRDSDHVIAVFKRGDCWGAISKSNHVWLRWRDPIYRSLRELAMSYFHEYYNRRDHKTLREYSVPFDLRRFDPKLWISGEKNAWPVAEELDAIRHFPLLNGHHLKAVARRDPFERRVGVLLQYRRPRALLEKLARLKKKRKK